MDEANDVGGDMDNVDDDVDVNALCSGLGERNRLSLSTHSQLLPDPLARIPCA